jgi:hypothetical protein
VCRDDARYPANRRHDVVHGFTAPITLLARLRVALLAGNRHTPGVLVSEAQRPPIVGPRVKGERAHHEDHEECSSNLDDHQPAGLAPVPEQPQNMLKHIAAL